MNSDVHPAVAGLVILMTVLAASLWAWASGVAAALGGPAALRTGPNGHHFIEIQNYLVEHDAEGAYLKSHDLDAIDVEMLLGAYAFFSNGDILLRRGPDPRSFLDKLRAYQRQTNRNSIVPEQSGSGLYRCNLDSLECSRFGEEGIDFKATFGVFIDWQTDEVYVSDTTRHLLRKYSSDGVELAPPVGGFRFPNQLMLHDGHLLVADTNNHVIRRLESQSSSFAKLIDSESVVPAAAKSAQQTWPSHFARVGENWWVNNMQTGMNHGGIYVFDDEWQFLRRLQLPSEADPISLLPLADAVWVSDWNNDVVRRFSAAGEPLPNLESAGLEDILSLARQERLTFTLLSYAGVVLVGLMLIGLLVRAFVLGRNKGTARKTSGELNTDEAVLHLEPDDNLRRHMTTVLRLMIVLGLMSGVLLAYLLWMFADSGVRLELLGIVASLFAIILLIAWVDRGNWGTSIQVDGRTLILRDHTGKKSRCAIAKVRFDATAIATPDAIVMLGRPRMQIYKRADIEERLLPRLADAQRIGSIEMLKIQIQLGHPQGLLVLIVIVAALGYGLVSLAT